MMRSYNYKKPEDCKFDGKCDGRCLKFHLHLNHTGRPYCLDIYCSDKQCKKNHLLSTKNIDEHGILFYADIILNIYDEQFIKDLISNNLSLNNNLILSIQDRLEKRKIRIEEKMKRLEEERLWSLERRKSEKENETILRKHRLKAFININKKMEDILNNFKLKINNDSIFNIIIKFLGE
jgi:hypothetical protein